MAPPPTRPVVDRRKGGAAGPRHELAGVVLFTVALLLGLSLLSYSPRDPILFEESFHPESIQNLIGQVGMTLATAVFAAVGGGGYLVPIALGILEIGRASGRGRVEISGVAVSLKKKKRRISR